LLSDRTILQKTNILVSKILFSTIEAPN